MKLNFRVKIIGDKGVGRGTFLKDQEGFPYKETIGVDLYRKNLTIEGVDLTLNIWNISYEDDHKNLFPSFMRNTHITLLMFDITRVASFDFLFEFPKLIREYGGDGPILLIGNKKDLEEAREVSGDTARAFVQDNKLMGYIEISGQDRQDCEELFNMIGVMLYHDLEKKGELRVQSKIKRRKKRSKRKKSQK